MIKERQIKEVLQEEIKIKATIWEKTIIMLSIIIFLVTAYVFHYALIHDKYLLTILAILIFILSSLEILLVLWRKNIKNQEYAYPPISHEN